MTRTLLTATVGLDLARLSGCCNTTLPDGVAAPQKTLKTGKIGGSQQQRITTMVSRRVLAVILPTILSIAQAVAARADDARTALVHACER